jgi:hypothetical protein
MIQCRNNVKQLATSLHNFESARRYFPGHGGEQPPNRVDFGPERRARAAGIPPTSNWILQSLPYMEQGALAKLLIAGSQGHGNPDELAVAVKTPVPSLYCPSRRPPQAYPLWSEVEIAVYGPAGARTDYAINGGSSEQGPTSDASDLSPDGGDTPDITLAEDGVWALGVRTKARSIVDGLSNTYLVGEKAMDSLQYETGRDVGDRAPIAALLSHHGAANSYVRFAARTPAVDVENNCRACHNFGSAHPTSMNMSMADGSVHALSYETDIYTHRAQATIAAEEVAGEPPVVVIVVRPREVRADDFRSNSRAVLGGCLCPRTPPRATGVCQCLARVHALVHLHLIPSGPNARQPAARRHVGESAAADFASHPERMTAISPGLVAPATYPGSPIPTHPHASPTLKELQHRVACPRPGAHA